VAVATIVDYLGGLVLPDTPAMALPAGLAPAARLAGLRRDFYQCLKARTDALFELTDAVLCTDGPVTSLVELSLTAEHRRGHGALYDGLNWGDIDIARLRVTLAELPLPRTNDGRIVLAVDVSNWLRPEAVTSPDRLFCHVYGRAKGQAQMIPGWPYSFVAALESGRTSWHQSTTATSGTATPELPAGTGCTLD
jgi:DDE superfamily endonuclease